MELKDYRLFRSKKGIFFTLIAVSLLAILLLTYSATYSYSMYEKSSVIESRVESMNSLVQEIDTDMRNAIYIAGFRAIIGLEDHVANTGTFVNDTETVFEELFLNGTVAGINSSVMVNNTFPDWMRKITAQANTVGMNMTLSIGQVNVRHTTPWNVRIEVNATLNVYDVKATANWTQQKKVAADVSVIGFEDPLYAVYTSNNVVKRINETIYEGNFTTVSTNTTNIRDHVAQTMYANFSGAPSFLMRFENDLNASIYGIESFVVKSEVSPYHPCPAETSSIDSIYWTCNTSINAWPVANWSGFRIDNETGIFNDTRIYRYMMEDKIMG